MAPLSAASLLKGGLSGLLAAWMLGAILSAQGQLDAFVGGMAPDSRAQLWLVVLMVGALAGIGFSALYPSPKESVGAGLIRGTIFGFLCWVVLPLSVLPELLSGTLLWRLDQVRGVFASFPAYVLFGAATAVFYQWLRVVLNVLFSETSAMGEEDGLGAQGLRAMGRGVVAGLVGGLVFTGIMVKIGALPRVAGLVDSTSPVAGFFVHLGIAVVVGATYGLFFRRQSYDAGSALGWGASYGFIWWLIGPNTLLPAFLGTTPVWSAEAAARVFPSLVGHLGYGAGLGIVLYLLEARYRPWWVPRGEADAERIARRREQVLTSAPALWALIVVIALTLPILLGTEGPATDIYTSPTY